MAIVSIKENEPSKEGFPSEDNREVQGLVGSEDTTRSQVWEAAINQIFLSCSPNVSTGTGTHMDKQMNLPRSPTEAANTLPTSVSGFISKNQT